MKTILEINGINYSSTGNITLNIAKELRNNGYRVYTACKNSKMGQKFQYEDQIFIGSRFERIISDYLGHLTGLKDHFNIFNTRSFIKTIKRIKPDLIHMHLLHDTYLNLNMFFRFLKQSNIPVIWTLHDCWPITGQCSYFDLVKCDKWKNGCYECPQTNTYPRTFFIDNTKNLWKEKKKWFTGVDNMTLVTPSLWLKNLVKESFMKDYPVKVIYNGINLDIFKPTESDFRKKYNLENKKIILGVSYGWSITKGVDVFIKLASMLPEDYQIVMVGGNDETDKMFPENIISIHKTYDQKELVEIYSACDLFLNPTRQDNFPTVNIEALSCGLPVLAFNTGGCPEIINDECGAIVEKDDIEAMKNEIIRILETNPYKKQKCIKRAHEFNMIDRFNEYVELIDQLLKDR